MLDFAKFQVLCWKIVFSFVWVLVENTAKKWVIAVSKGKWKELPQCSPGFPVPRRPPPLPHCGFPKSSFPSSSPPLNSLRSLSAGYLGHYLRANRLCLQELPSSSSQWADTPSSAVLEWGWGGGQGGWFSKARPSPSVLFPQGPCSNLSLLSWYIFNLLLVIDSIPSAYKPDSVSPRGLT